MGEFSDAANAGTTLSRFSELELQRMFSTAEEKEALAHIRKVLAEKTDDLNAITSLVTKGQAVAGVVTKLVRAAIASA
jgi:hypothetical protein